MLVKVCSAFIETKEDMNEMEKKLVGLLGGEQGKCAFMRSKEYVALRLRALYSKDAIDKPMIVYGEGIKLSLNPNKTLDLYLLEMGVDDDVTMLGKRRGGSGGDSDEDV
jgi:hypothetical protein